MNLSFDALRDFAAMHSILRDLSVRFDALTDNLKNVTVANRSMGIPTMSDIRGESKSFLQKADHVAVALFGVAKLFYGNRIGPKWFESLYNVVEKHTAIIILLQGSCRQCCRCCNLFGTPETRWSTPTTPRVSK